MFRGQRERLVRTFLKYLDTQSKMDRLYFRFLELLRTICEIFLLVGEDASHLLFLLIFLVNYFFPSIISFEYHKFLDSPNWSYICF